MSIKTKHQGSSTTIHITGDLTTKEAPKLYAALGKVLKRKQVKSLTLDFSEVKRLDTSGIAVLSIQGSVYQKRGIAFSVQGIKESHKEAMALMPGETEPTPPPKIGFLEALGGWLTESGTQVRSFFAFVFEILHQIVRMFTRREWIPKGAFTEEAVRIGVNALPIVGLSSLLMGLVLAFQGDDQLSKFGAGIFVANLVGVSMAREFAPLVTGIIIAGRSGSAIAAELGTMNVQEELDALRTMGLEPTKFLALPKLFAITLMQPALTFLAMCLGVFGGLVIGVFYMKLSPAIYLERTIEALTPNHVVHGLFKSLMFAWITGTISCFCGFNIEGGASGVGQATTKAVVMSIFMLIVADSVATTASTLTKGLF